jgi:hypothetical protein
MNRLSHWLRYVLPSTGTTLFFLSVLIFARVVGEVLMSVAGDWSDVIGPDAPNVPNMFRGYNGFCVMAPSLIAACYGMYRAMARNPILNDSYAETLRRIPWQWPMPLPWGAVLPAWQDLLILPIFSLFALTDFSSACLLPPLFAVVAYMALLALSSSRFGLHEEHFVIGFALAAAIHWRGSPHIWPIGLVVALVFACRTTATTLSNLHDWKLRFWGRDLQQPRALAEEGRLGALFEALAPVRRGHIFTVRLAALCGALAAAGIWAFNLPTIGPEADLEFHWIISAMALPFALARPMYFSMQGGAPLTLRGRVHTGRIFIPRYDLMFVPSLALLATAMLLPFALKLLPISFLDQVAIAVGVYVALLFGLPPSLEHWRLTSECHFRSASSEQVRRSSAKFRQSRAGTAVRP